MIQISAFQLLFVFFFVLLIIILLLSGRSHSNRRYIHHHHPRRPRRYRDDAYDDYDDYDERYREDYRHGRTGRDTGISAIIILLVMSVAGVSSYFEKSKGGETTQSVIQPAIPALPLSLDDNHSNYSEKKGEEIGYSEFYIRVKEFKDKNELESYADSMVNKGLTISTIDQKNKTIVFVGPFKTKGQAERINWSYRLNGTIEAY